MLLIAAPTGSGKTTCAAEFAARAGRTCWLSDRKEGADEAAALIEEHGGKVGRVLPLDGKSMVVTRGEADCPPIANTIPNCLHPDVIELWQSKGYDYRRGYCRIACERRADPGCCPFLRSLDDLEHADSIVVTKAMARGEGFFTAHGNDRRANVIIDEDPIGLLKTAVEITRDDLNRYIPIAEEIEAMCARPGKELVRAEAGRTLDLARWCWDTINGRPPGDEPGHFPLPGRLMAARSVGDRGATRWGRDGFRGELHRRMRDDPHGTVRNVHRDLDELARRSAGRSAYATSDELMFHVRVSIPKSRRVIVLDATASRDLLETIFAPRPVEVLCDRRVSPVGRVIQVMDANHPRSSVASALNASDRGKPPKLIRLLDAIGDRHPHGRMVLISFKEHVDGLRDASRHAGRIETAHFGALRGRNDLQEAACHVVVGSPKASEAARRQLALAVYGRSILPFSDLVDVRLATEGRIPRELSASGEVRLWESRQKGYLDPRMQAVYDHTVGSELAQAADRARVLANPTTVYLLTNEACPGLWFAEPCLARELLDVSPPERSDYRENYDKFAAKACELLDAGGSISGAEVCRALGRDESWGKRYWRGFRAEYGDALEGDRKVRWCASRAPSEEDARSDAGPAAD